MPILKVLFIVPVSSSPREASSNGVECHNHGNLLWQRKMATANEIPHIMITIARKYDRLASW
jgi:isopentenyl diphosphate isomerase/L-lactate dehydrogenase-like FMN-dependent dehydrogenase